jgi:hypothetical protein
MMLGNGYAKVRPQRARALRPPLWAPRTARSCRVVRPIPRPMGFIMPRQEAPSRSECGNRCNLRPQKVNLFLNETMFTTRSIIRCTPARANRFPGLRPLRTAQNGSGPWRHHHSPARFDVGRIARHLRAGGQSSHGDRLFNPNTNHWANSTSSHFVIWACTQFLMLFERRERGGRLRLTATGGRFQ